MEEKSKYQRWKQGMKELTPAQMAHAQVAGHMGGMIGLGLAAGVLAYRFYFSLDLLQLGFFIFLVAMVWLQWWQYKSAKQRYQNAAQMMEVLTDEGKN